jgi:hypothetical protein
MDQEGKGQKRVRMGQNGCQRWVGWPSGARMGVKGGGGRPLGIKVGSSRLVPAREWVWDLAWVRNGSEWVGMGRHGSPKARTGPYPPNRAILAHSSKTRPLWSHGRVPVGSSDPWGPPHTPPWVPFRGSSGLVPARTTQPLIQRCLNRSYKHAHMCYEVRNTLRKRLGH